MPSTQDAASQPEEPKESATLQPVLDVADVDAETDSEDGDLDRIKGSSDATRSAAENAMDDAPMQPNTSHETVATESLPDKVGKGDQSTTGDAVNEQDSEARATSSGDADSDLDACHPDDTTQRSDAGPAVEIDALAQALATPDNKPSVQNQDDDEIRSPVEASPTLSIKSSQQKVLPQSRQHNVDHAEEDAKLFSTTTPQTRNTKTYGGGSSGRSKATASPSVAGSPTSEMPVEAPDAATGMSATVSRKRKARPDQYEVSPDRPVAKKARTDRLPKVAQPSENDDDDETVVAPKASSFGVTPSDALSPGPLQSTPEEPVAEKSRKGRLRRVLRPTVGDDDEIVRAPKASSSTSTPSDALSPGPMQDKLSKVLLSGCSTKAKTLKWLKTKVKVVEEVPGKTSKFICVVPEKQLKTTIKVLRSLLANKAVVYEEWITDSHKQGQLLDYEGYLHMDVADTVRTSRKSLFTGYTIFFTRAAAKSYGKACKDIVEMAKQAGASAVETGTATRGHEMTPKERVLLLGLDDNDRDARALHHDHGRAVYDKTMFAQAIIRATVDLEDDEFRLLKK